MDTPPAGLSDADLHGRSALELADVAVTACRRWYRDLAAVSLVFCVPILAVGWVLFAAISNVGPLIAASVLAVALAHAGCVDITGDGWLGSVPAWRPAVRRTLRRAPAVLGVWVMGGLLVALGTAMLLVPGVVILLGLVPAIPLLVLERTSPAAAIGRARKLAEGRRPTYIATLGVLIGAVVTLLAILVQPVIVAALLTGGRDAPLVVGIAIGQLGACLLVVPLVAAATTAAYLDARVRTEALDLLYLLSSTDGTGAPAAANAAAP